MIANLNERTQFQHRHIGPDDKQIKDMLSTIGAESLNDLIDKTVPESIRRTKPLNIPHALDEFSYLHELRKKARQNQVFKSFIGMGYYNTVTPTVVQRNILENPGWYTAYTPYQAEIAQGRLEMLVNFQTMVSDLSGMEIANASLLDEATAAAEAMAMQFALRKKTKKNAFKYFIDKNVYPQTIDVLTCRALPLGIELIIDDFESLDTSDIDFFGLLVQFPNLNGQVTDYSKFFSQAKSNDITIAVAADLMSLVLMTPPGDIGADVVVGTTQRFGVPMGYGGPHAGYFATKEEYKRQIPGRIIGVSVDANGKQAYRMALQTREQHIRREKATSNICTAQVLLAVTAAAYGVYHGPKGLKRIASMIHGFAKLADQFISQLGFEQVNDSYFDTLLFKVSNADRATIRQKAESLSLNFNYFIDGHIGVSFDETHTVKVLNDVISAFAASKNISVAYSDVIEAANGVDVSIEESLTRKSEFLTHPIFDKHQSEHEMLRYLKSLENKDISLTHSMISLGSCTMKLNATSEMLPITWPEFGMIHPFAPKDQLKGYEVLITELTEWLAEITDFDTVSLQPNSGAQGEFAGLMVIKAYHASLGEDRRNITLIPSSAHGTNPASAIMAGNQVVIVKCDELGNIDLDDLRAKAELHKDNLSSLMITYPSTHGVFEESVVEICDIVHHFGGQVYMDGANMNAQVGLTSPGIIGADVCHLNLHKTFAIPHGGGGPGIGPIGVAKHLSPFLPGHTLVSTGHSKSIHAVSAAPYGSAGVLLISYGYIAMMGQKGLIKATKIAILNANYIKSKLETTFKVLYQGKSGRCAHELILDCREFKTFGIEVEDIAKRLMDYGFHAPTVSFPVPGTLMIEPTESETTEELDRFCEAMLQIHNEIIKVKDGLYDSQDNVLKNAPHTAEVVMSDEWQHAYSRSEAAYPLSYLRSGKFWPSVGRVDNAYGDRNLFCSCIPVDQFELEEVEG